MKMQKLVCFFLSVALPASIFAQSAGAKAQTPLSGVRGAFFALSVADAETSAEWYVDKLGLSVETHTEAEKVKVIILSGNGLIVELLQHQDGVELGKEFPHPHGIVKAGVVVENLDKALAILKARNVQIAYGPYPAKANSMANFIIQDNSGNLIQFFGK